MKVEMYSEMHFEIESPLDAFAAENGLTMVVRDRQDVPARIKFYAHFRGVDVIDGQMLCISFGAGYTPDAAIAEYTKKISGKMLSISEGASGRRKVKAPKLTC